MKVKKFTLTDETMCFNGKTLHRIKALKSFSSVKEGDLGGWVESEDNLSQNDNCWIADNAEEFIIALQKHGNFIQQKLTSYFPINVDNEGVMLHFHGLNSNISFKDLFEMDWRFVDGTICCKLINK